MDPMVNGPDLWGPGWDTPQELMMQYYLARGPLSDLQFAALNAMMALEFFPGTAVERPLIVGDLLLTDLAWPEIEDLADEAQARLSIPFGIDPVGVQTPVG